MGLAGRGWVQGELTGGRQRGPEKGSAGLWGQEEAREGLWDSGGANGSQECWRGAPAPLPMHSGRFTEPVSACLHSPKENLDSHSVPVMALRLAEVLFVSRTDLYLNCSLRWRGGPVTRWRSGGRPGLGRTLWTGAKVNCRRCRVSAPLGWPEALWGRWGEGVAEQTHAPH